MAVEEKPGRAVKSSWSGHKAIARAQSSRRTGWLWLAAGVVVAAPIVVMDAAMTNTGGQKAGRSTDPYPGTSATITPAHEPRSDHQFTRRRPLG